jgi:hypothetical protein
MRAILEQSLYLANDWTAQLAPKALPWAIPKLAHHEYPKAHERNKWRCVDEESKSLRKALDLDIYVVVLHRSQSIPVIRRQNGSHRAAIG